MAELKRRLKYCETCGIVLIPKVNMCPNCKGMWLGVINGIGKVVRK